MAPEKEVIDELSKLIISSNHAPLPWGSQQRLVDLFTELLEKQALEHKLHEEQTLKLVKFQQVQNDVLVKELHNKKGCYNYADSIRGSGQGRQVNAGGGTA